MGAQHVCTGQRTAWFALRLSCSVASALTHCVLLPALEHHFYWAVFGYLLSASHCPAASHRPSRLQRSLLGILINLLPHEVSLCIPVHLIYCPLLQDLLLHTEGFHSLRCWLTVVSQQPPCCTNAHSFQKIVHENSLHLFLLFFNFIHLYFILFIFYIYSHLIITILAGVWG